MDTGSASSSTFQGTDYSPWVNLTPSQSNPSTSGSGSFTPPKIKAPNKPTKDCAQLKKDLAYQLKVFAQNGGTIEGVEGMSDLDKTSLVSLVTGTGVAAYGLYTDSRLAANGSSLPLGMTRYTNMSPGYAKLVTRAGIGLGLVGVAADSALFYKAAAAGDMEGAGWSGANVTADVAALALAGPGGVAIGVAQVGINLGLTAYTNNWNAQLAEQAKGVTQQMERTRGVANRMISDTMRQMQTQGCK